MAGRLLMCATPIGNLADASPALGEALAGAAVVYAEDTRRSRILLAHLGVSVPVRSYFAGNEQARQSELREHLRVGDTVALVTDAGTPGISDPGLSAVRAAVEEGAVVSVVPGPSAVTAALAVAGMPAQRFVFEGFLPRKGGARSARLEALAREERTIVLFSAPRRVVSDLEALSDALGGDRDVVVCRELTKLHEEVFRGTLLEAARHWDSGEEPRGEFTLVLAGGERGQPDLAGALAEVASLVADGTPLSDAVRTVASLRRVSRRDLYEEALRSRDGA